MTITACVVLGLAAVVASGPATAGAAPAGVRISSVYFDPPGSDTGSDASLNSEYVRITNTARTAASSPATPSPMPRDTGTKFPTTALNGGASLRVHSGFGLNNPTNRYQRSSNYIWNNTGDTATLRAGSGALIGRCSYSDAISPKTC